MILLYFCTQKVKKFSSWKSGTKKNKKTHEFDFEISQGVIEDLTSDGFPRVRSDRGFEMVMELMADYKIRLSISRCSSKYHVYSIDAIL